ncbi:DivIVA domain-containing protein [Spirillospora sp. NPDC048911]|uniref:DivIVA domain-containing protein n=1 Tax=Spirillospora sp. NPDC048911 TaxID=3364527 RepID=UPI00371D1C94
MNNEAEILPNLLREESFEIVMRGYNRRQVDEFIARSQNQIRELEARLARALDDVERTRREMAEVREARKPTGDDLSDRLRQIINLAEDEAKDKIAEAEAKGGQIRKEAESESKRIVEEARGHAEEDLAQAKQKADHVLASAKKESDSVLTAAKQEAEQTVTSARLEAERTLTASERRASVINEGATTRLTQLTKNHTQALQRLTEISETLNRLLKSENDAGPLEKMVEDAVKQPIAPAPQRKQPIPAGVPAAPVAQPSAAKPAPVAPVAPVTPAPPAPVAAPTPAIKKPDPELTVADTHAPHAPQVPQQAKAPAPARDQDGPLPGGLPPQSGPKHPGQGHGPRPTDAG